jgi:lysophospholipase L1-like esterase
VAALPSARTTRRIATAAAYSGGGLGVLSASLYGLLRAQASWARRSIDGHPKREPPHADGRYGTGSGEPISFVVLGDSAAAGYGADRPAETPGALLAAGLAEQSGRVVRLTSVAVVGARSTDLGDQLPAALTAAPDIALIVVGGNDVTQRVPPAESVRSLHDAVTELRAHGCAVVVGTCPDLGTIQPIQPPLRWLARRWSRGLAAAQAVAVVDAGGRAVSVGSILGPEFAAAPGDLFSEDRFHPSPAGYARAAAALLPSLLSALGLSSEEEERPDPLRGDDVLPVAAAATAASAESGTEISATTVGGRARGPRGAWAQLRHRRRRSSPDPEHAAVPDAASVSATAE